MKRKINVIDLDNTLIPFDSFRRLVLQQISKFNIGIAFIAILRLIRVISGSEFKKRIIIIIEYHNKSKIYKQFSDFIIQSINKSLLEKLRKITEEKYSINILCSASPNGYVRLVAEKLGWIGCGSYLYNDNNDFYHMHGKNKKEFIKRKFPEDRYLYNYAISDNESDLGLLKMFREWELY